MFSQPALRLESVRMIAPGSKRFLRQCAIVVSALVMAACATPPGGDADNASTQGAIPTKSAKSKLGKPATAA
jgi:rare lipoprotein A